MAVAMLKLYRDTSLLSSRIRPTTAGMLEASIGGSISMKPINGFWQIDESSQKVQNEGQVCLQSHKGTLAMCETAAEGVL